MSKDTTSIDQDLFEKYIDLLHSIDRKDAREYAYPTVQGWLKDIDAYGLVNLQLTADLVSEWLEPAGLTDLGRQLLYACRNKTFVSKITDYDIENVIDLLVVNR
ncbi:hypothetical protein [Advenella sp. EE-W14]|uniref:hypothetical protein n=1 Tax=Advenella sp. EE-W14 TaxID=2722705 RepID=UPI00145F668F|nr:hypothetical protein [Advenella sp. EE-W14]